MWLYLFQALSLFHLITINISLFITNNQVLKNIVDFVCDARCYLYKRYYQIREEPNSTSWLSISYLSKNKNASKYIFHEYYDQEGLQSSEIFINTMLNDKSVSECLITCKKLNGNYSSQVVPVNNSHTESKSYDLDSVAQMHNLSRKNIQNEDDTLLVKSPFLNIEFYQEGLENPIFINIPHSYFAVDNKLLSPTFVTRYLIYNHGNQFYDSISTNYKVVFIDRMLNYNELNSKQRIEITKSGYLTSNLYSPSGQQDCL